MDEIDLSGDDEVPGLDQTSEKNLDEISLELGELEAAPESLGLDELSEDIGLEEDLLAFSGSDQNDLSEDAKQWLVNKGFDPAYGARPLHRLVQTAIGDKLAKVLLSGEAHDGDTVHIGVASDGAELTVSA